MSGFSRFDWLAASKDLNIATDLMRFSSHAVYVIENKSEWMRERNILERVRDAPAAAVWHTECVVVHVLKSNKLSDM